MIGRLSGSSCKCELFCVADHYYRARCADEISSQDFVERVNGRNRLPIKLDEHIAFTQSRRASGAVRLDRDHQDAAWRTQMVKADQSAVQRNVLSANAQKTAPDFAFLDEPRSHVLCGINADVEADALSRQNDGRVDPNDLTARI